jgi:hypothetical protein
MAFGIATLGRGASQGIRGPQTTAASEQTSVLTYLRRLQEQERHRTLLNYFAFYDGLHWSFLRSQDEPQITINYCRAFIDKSASALFANGFNFQTPEGEDTSPELDVCNEVWEYNLQDELGMKIGTMGGTSGDVFLKVAYIPSMDKIALVLLDTQTCFPIWSGSSKGTFDSFKVEYIIADGAAGDLNDIHVYTELYTNDNMIELALDGQVYKKYENLVGYIPIVHIKNKGAPRSYYGLPDHVDVIPLQRIYNEQTTKFQDIVNYHAEPVTLVYGTRMSNLTHGARKIWSGIPITARIENLNLESDLGALQNFITSLKESMHELASIPINSLGKEQQISNTSNAALLTQYLPLYDLTNRKQITYGVGIEQANFFILDMYKRFVQDKKVSAADIDTTQRIVPNWPSFMPKDLERLISAQFVPLESIGLLDREEALKQMGVRNAAQALAKIDADRVAKAKVDAQVAEIVQQPEVDAQQEQLKMQGQMQSDQADQQNDHAMQQQKAAGGVGGK